MVTSAFAAEESDTTAIPAEKITLESTLLTALEANISLRIETLDPQIVEKNEAIAKAEFDPEFSAGVTYDVDEVNDTSDATRSADDMSAEVGISKKFATGTTVSLSVDASRDETTSTSSDDKRYTDSIGPELRITQALLRGRGLDVNLANVRRAQINTAISEQQLRRFVETLIYNVSISYWNLFLEQQKLRVFQESYDLALEHEHEVEVFIDNGELPEIELATVKGEVSARRERLIQARGAIEKARLALLSVTNYHSISSQGWTQALLPIDNPRKVYDKLDLVDPYVDVALVKRPELAEAELRIEREQVSLVATKNGLLPKLDFFISLGRTDYANSFRTSADTDNDEQFLTLGLDYSFGVGRRAERARYEQDQLDEQRAIFALQNLRDSINREVRQAYIDCTTDYETIDAVGVTRELRRQSLKTQTIKFELGKATNTDIANAQRDLLQSQINYTEAIVDYVKSRLRLHYLDGSLIERSGVVLP